MVGVTQYKSVSLDWVGFIINANDRLKVLLGTQWCINVAYLTALCLKEGDLFYQHYAPQGTFTMRQWCYYIRFKQYSAKWYQYNYRD
jgi:hypothetical protein